MDMNVIEEWKGLKLKAKELEDEASLLKARAKDLEEKILEDMIENGVSKLSTSDGRTVYIKTSFSSKVLEAFKGDIAQIVIGAGYPELATVNSRTLQSFVKEEVEQFRQENPDFLLHEGNLSEAIPDFLKGKVEVGEMQMLAMRKS